MMMMQVRRATLVDLPPKRQDRSMTGTTAPRRLITPRMKGGIMGISVTLPYSMISLTLRMATANISPPRVKVRYCCGVLSVATSTPPRAGPGVGASWLIVRLRSEFLEIRVVDQRGYRACRGTGRCAGLTRGGGASHRRAVTA